MADVGLGQVATATGESRSRVAKKANEDNHPIFFACNRVGGIVRKQSGETVVNEAISDQNDSTNWVGERGTVSLAENNVLDASQYSWRYILAAVIMSRAEQLKNRTPDRYIPLLATKFTAAEVTMKNKAHEGVLSSGTGVGGLQVPGLAALVSTTPTSGTHGGIDHSSSDAVWHRNQKFDTSGDWSDGAVDSGNVTRFLDQGLDAVMVNSEPMTSVGIMGSTHWKALQASTRALQFIDAGSTTARHGHNRQVYRGVEFYLGNGLNYSGFTAQTATRTYILNVEKGGGFNINYMNGGEYDMLEPVNSNDQALMTRLLFTMMCCSVGAYAQKNWVGFD